MCDLSEITFYKYSATGNDFILFDNRAGHFTGQEVDFFREICQRRTAVGADGVLLIENSSEHDFRMRYFNADGSEATCGNGARSAAHFAFHHRIAASDMTFTVGGEVYSAQVNDQAVKLKMSAAREVNIDVHVVEEAGFEEGGFVNTGVPHFVLFCENLEQVDVNKIGRQYRRHVRFQPAGANVNFVQIVSITKIKLRTYERGVEEETLSCGTGCLASAFLAQLAGRTKLPTEVVTRGGTLLVALDPRDKRLLLTGNVALIYEGKLGKLTE